MVRTPIVFTGIACVLVLGLGLAPRAKHASSSNSSGARATEADRPGQDALAISLMGSSLIPAPDSAVTLPTRTPATPHFTLASQRNVHDLRTWLKLATVDDAPALRQLALGDSDPLVAGRALRRLADLDLVAGDAALLVLLQDTRPRVRQEAVVAFGRAKDPAAADAVAQLLPAADATLRPLVLQALAAIGGDVPCVRLRQALTDPRATAADHVYARPSSAPR